MVRPLRTPLCLSVAAVLLAACSSSSASSGHGSSSHQTAQVACAGSIGVMAPYGGSSQRDTVQMNWARVALDQFNNDHGTSFTITPENVDFSETDAVASAQRLAADPSVIGVVGPTTSVAVAAAAPVLDQAGLAYVSQSATRTSLTDGSHPGFHRVVANDSVQGPTIAKFVSDHLKGKEVLVVGDPEAYSVGLTDSIKRQLHLDGVAVRSATIGLEGADPAPAVSAMTPSTDVVILALLQPTDATHAVDAITADGYHPTFIGADSMFDLNTFNIPGAYVSTFAPDLTALPGGAKLVTLYKSIFGDLAPLGGPSYVAMEVMLTAALKSCHNGEARRKGTAKAIGDVKLDHTILGTPVSFTKTGDLKDGTYSIYQIEGQGYSLVR